MNGYTKGPWIADDGDACNWAVFQEQDRQAICYLTLDGGLLRPNEEGEANARLIAAAPELLEALKEIESVMRMYGDGMFGGPLAKTIRAAIAKAEAQ